MKLVDIILVSTVVILLIIFGLWFSHEVDKKNQYLETPKPEQAMTYQESFTQCLTNIPTDPASTKYNDWVEVI